MKLPFALTMALRETRSSRRRLGLYTGAIGLGVAALVSINSFRANVATAIDNESRNLLGADLELRTRRPFPKDVLLALDSTERGGPQVSYMTVFNSMALVKRSGLTRFVEVRGVEGPYPYYGEIETDPAGRWNLLGRKHMALVDPAVLVQLDAARGDTVSIGKSSFVVDGSLIKVPGDIGFRTVFAPRIYIPARYIEETGLLGFGSRTAYRAYLKFASEQQLSEFLENHLTLFRTAGIRYDTAAERQEQVARTLDLMARFLGMVGLIALLLGGIGVASAVHVFIKDKLPTVAVLRCLGTTQATILKIYLAQAALTGLIGAIAGALLGIMVQVNLPTVLADFLPLEVPISIEWPTILTGLGIGMWAAVAFALLPLLTVRNVSPLRAIRRGVEEAPPQSGARYWVYGALLASVFALSMWQAPEPKAGAAFAGAIITASALLWLAAWAMMKTIRRLLQRRLKYIVRQGIANLFRPHNQTVAVTLAVGFGVFLITALYVVQKNIIAQIAIDESSGTPSLVLFDIQRNQKDSVERIISAHGMPVLGVTPIAPARISHIKGVPVSQLLTDTTSPRRSRWPLTREYRNSYRDSLVPSEEVVAGSWWNQDDSVAGGPSGKGVPRISLEADLASQLRVGLGDHITWDLQGVPVETEIANLRSVDWAQLSLNFFAIFEPGAIDNAPQTFVALTGDESARRRAELQRDIVIAFPNVSALDLTVLQETVNKIVGSVTFAIRFMAVFSIASGLIVLLGAIATSKFQRIRESVLLRTLGARRPQIRLMLLTEYGALGFLSGLTGTVLGTTAGWALVTYLFEMPFSVSSTALLVFCFGTVAVTVVVGLGASREVVRRPPLAVIREMAE
ncbi:MAG: ABC transporter permease [Gemmatimonadales bacterium]